MIKSLLNRLEDPQRPLLGPNFLLLTKVGLLLPKNKFRKFLHVFWIQISTVVLSGVIIEFFAVKSDINTAINNLKTTTLAFIIFAKASVLMNGQDKLQKVVDYVTDADQYERMASDEIRSRIIVKYTKYCRQITYFYVGITYLTGLTLISSPFLIYMSSETLRNDLKNGTVPFPHIISTWMPFDKNHSPGNWVTVVYTVFAILWGASVIPACDTLILVVMVFFRGKLELLRERCKLTLGNDGNSIPDDEAKKTIRELHKTHVMLMTHMKMFNSLISPIMFTYVLSCSLMICASSFQLVTATSIIEQFLIMEFLVFAVAQLFMFCWHSSDMQEKNEELMLGPYESQWWAANIRQRKDILILAGQLSIVHPYTAGPFNYLTLNLFIMIVKGAYSYFTLLRK